MLLNTHLHYDSIVGNSTQHMNILYPTISFNKKHKVLDNNINNVSVLYQVCIGNKKMLFAGDIETVYMVI